MEMEKYLLRLISSKAYTREELRKKLECRQFNSDKIEPLLDIYENYGYIDDLAYAKLYLASHEQWGKLKLLDRMREKGLARDVIEKALDQYGFDETATSERLFLEMHSNGLEWGKIYKRLLSRGFSSGSLRAGMERALSFTDSEKDSN